MGFSISLCFYNYGRCISVRILGFGEAEKSETGKTETEDCFHSSCDESEFEKRMEAREMG